jgi:hypothetical protein
MGLFFWKDNKKIDQFAQAIADELFSQVRPDSARQFFSRKPGLEKKQLRKIEQKLNDAILQAQRFCDSNSLGIYGKARLQKQFNERLAELGYELEVVDRISRSMLMQKVEA